MPYRPRDNVPKATLYVTGFVKGTTARSLASAFEKYGTLAQVNVLPPRQSDDGQFGFVAFRRIADMERVLGDIAEGKPLDAEFALDHEKGLKCEKARKLPVSQRRAGGGGSSYGGDRDRYDRYDRGRRGYDDRDRDRDRGRYDDRDDRRRRYDDDRRRRYDDEFDRRGGSGGRSPAGYDRDRRPRDRSYDRDRRRDRDRSPSFDRRRDRDGRDGRDRDRPRSPSFERRDRDRDGGRDRDRDRDGGRSPLPPAPPPRRNDSPPPPPPSSGSDAMKIDED
ncbi:unnamed protein product [Ambrosiozyma monospora]|uniref:Unnamed protein product n=1 Tax=Ambrosiozyma monospora TaxID=43982 RepID=A0ACB5TD47_AMBMO|nr:unnamed protein product [Ambrosiozyma monospora]